MESPTPAFARDAATADYYERRATEYDDWYTGDGLFAGRDRPGWHAEVVRLRSLVSSLPAARTLDIACGTGFLTRHLAGLVVGIDQSPAMVAIAQSRLPNGVALIGDALGLPFADNAFDRVLTGHFYGHLPLDERGAFLAEARRVARELVVIDAAVRPGVDPEQWQPRVLNDGSTHRVYKRYLRPDQLVAEIGDGGIGDAEIGDAEVLLDGDWFVAVRVRTSAG